MSTMFNSIANVGLGFLIVLLSWLLVDSLIRAIRGDSRQVRRVRVGRWARYYPNATRGDSTHGRPYNEIGIDERLALYVICADGIASKSECALQCAIDDTSLAMALRTMRKRASGSPRTIRPRIGPDDG